MENEKKGQYYNPGDTLWRHSDNALFQIIAIVCDEPVTPSQNKTYYKFHCINGVTENDEIAYCDLVATGKTALSPIAPSDLKLNQHIWTKSSGREYVVIDIFPGEKPKHPCHNCHDGICEQCTYGYKSDDQIMSMIGNRSSDTKYRIESLDHKRSYDIDNNALKEDSEYTIYPPMYVEDKSLLIVETDKTGKEIKSAKKVELDLPDKEEEEEEVLGMTDEELDEFIEDLNDKKKKDSYQKWKESLHVIQVPAFDLNYFKVGDAYLIQEHAYVGFKHNAILITAEKDKLGFLNASEKAWTSPVSEYKEISLKDYLDGKYGIKKLVVEEKENA